MSAMPVVLSVLFGLAFYLLYEGLTNPRPAHRPNVGLGGVEHFLHRAGLPDVTPRAFLGFSVAVALTVGLAAQLVLGWYLVSGIAAVLAGLVPLVYYVHREQRRREAIQLAMVDAIAQLRDAIRTGFSVQDALATLAQSGPEALRPEFSRLMREIRVAGFESALLAFRDRLADPVGDIVCSTLLLSDRIGGRHLSPVLDHLAQATRSEQRVQQELHAAQARNVLSARIVAAVPLVVIVVVRAMNPRYLSVFDDWWGQIVLAACAASIALGYAGMLWMTRLPGDRRVLTQ